MGFVPLEVLFTTKQWILVDKKPRHTFFGETLYSNPEIIKNKYKFIKIEKLKLRVQA